MRAFEVKRSTLSMWKKQRTQGKGLIDALNERSRTPKMKRKRLWPIQIISEIKQQREEHPNEDIHTRFAFAWSTTSHASLAAKEFFEYCRMVFPHQFEYVLTDNGSEFMKHFDEELRRLHLIHYHTYPRTPKMNAHCERFNRTIQEEFVDYHAGSLLDPSQFNQKLIPWLIWYNTERPHWGLDLKSPMQFMLTAQSQDRSNVRWTDTKSCNSATNSLWLISPSPSFLVRHVKDAARNMRRGLCMRR